MGSKIITEGTLSNEQYQEVKELAASIKKRHTVINTETELIAAEKSKITTISTDLFFSDLEAEVPAINGNHEYHTDDGIVRVNFRVKNTPMNTINDKDAKILLEGVFGEGYGSLFEEAQRHTLKAEQKDMFTQAASTPELFNIKLKEGLSVGDLKKLVISYPDLLEVGVKDLNKYVENYPESVVTNTTVSLKDKFLERADKLGADSIQKARKFLKVFLKPRMTPAVIVGNRSSK